MTYKAIVLDESAQFASYVQYPSNPARITYGSLPMAKSKDVINTKESPRVVSDSGQVRMGSASPAFPPVRGGPANTSDTEKMRIGSASPAFPPVRGGPANTSDTGKMRMGSASPAFPPVR